MTRHWTGEPESAGATWLARTVLALLVCTFGLGIPESAQAGSDIRNKVLGRSAEEWESLLTSDEPGIQRRAVQELQSFKKELIALFPMLMKSSSARVRFAAVTAFYGVRMPEVERVLVAALSDPEARVRETAYTGLMIQGPQTLGVLRKYAESLSAPCDSCVRLGPFWTGEGFLAPVDWSPDGDALSIAANGGGAVEIWDWRENSRLRTLDLLCDIHFLRRSPDGRWLATTGGAIGVCGYVSIWAFHRTEWIEPDFLSSGSTCVSWAPDSETFAYGANKELVVATVQGDIVLRRDFGETLRDVKFAPTGGLIGVCTDSGKVFVVEATSGSRHLCSEVKGIWLSWAPDGRSFLCTGQQAAAMYSLAEHRVEWERSGSFTLGGGGGEYCSDGARVVLVAVSRIEFVHAGTGASLRVIKDPQEDYRTFDDPRWSPGGRYVAVSDGMSIVWLMDTLPPVLGPSEESTALGDDLWSQLGSTDMETGLAAENVIAGAGRKGAEFIAARMDPVPLASSEEVKGLAAVAAAGGKDAASARQRLAELGPAAANMLRSFKPEELGAQVDQLVPWLLDQRVSIRTCRALSALVRNPAQASTEVLERLSGGQRGAPLTELARAFLRMRSLD